MLNSADIKKIIKNQGKNAESKGRFNAVVSQQKERIVTLKEKINDKCYVDVAIRKIASDIAQNFF
ncbi:MAG: hypothetical protein KAS64_02925 [Spirochaetes bacterium]|nr:hypothetical protein [Spirochaetota bacterium]